MLKNLFTVLLRATDETPEYHGKRCLVERQAVGGCDLCQTACPHDAVRLGLAGIDVERDACTGCGICVQVCPTGALEFELAPQLGLLKDQGRARAGEPRQPARLQCSKVKADGPTVLCLGRVTPATVLAPRGTGQELELWHADCSSCRVGGPSVPRELQEVLETASRYRETLGQGKAPARMVHWTEEVGVAPAPPPAPALTRREAVGALFAGAKRTGAKIIPDQVLPGIQTRPDAAPVPDEWLWRQRALRPAPPAGSEQHWPVPTVDEKCTMCPVCQNVCPTDAITRELDEAGTYSLKLRVDACTGCEACLRSCPPDAIRMSPTVPYEAIGGTVVLREEAPLTAQDGDALVGKA